MFRRAISSYTTCSDKMLFSCLIFSSGHLSTYDEKEKDQNNLLKTGMLLLRISANMGTGNNIKMQPSSRINS